MNKPTRVLIRGATIAALYTALTLALRPISFGIFQLRVSEALTLLPLIFIEAVPALGIGCFLANLIGGYGIVDATIGGATTLLAALLTSLLRRFINNTKRDIGVTLIAALPPVILNALTVPIILRLAGAVESYYFIMATTFVGQALAVVAIGIPLYFVYSRICRKLIKNH